MAMTERFSKTEMLMMAQRAIGRIDARGPRGAEECPIEEIIAMAATLVSLGVSASPYAGPPGSQEQTCRDRLTSALSEAAAEVSRELSTPPSTGDDNV